MYLAVLPALPPHAQADESAIAGDLRWRAMQSSPPACCVLNRLAGVVMFDQVQGCDGKEVVHGCQPAYQCTCNSKADKCSCIWHHAERSV